MKTLFFSIICSVLLFTGCSNNAPKEHEHGAGTHEHPEGTHEHEDGSVHQDHEAASGQETFTVGDSTAVDSTAGKDHGHDHGDHQH